MLNKRKEYYYMTLILSDVKYNFTTEAFESETVNDEMVLYFKDLKKALILNNTCSVIWEMIAEAQQEDIELNDETISSHLMEQFRLPEEMRQNVKTDIYELLQKFLTEKIVHMSVIVEENKGIYT